MGAALPLAFLEAAAPWYLAGADWDALSDDWLEQALAYGAAPCKGIRGPLSRIRPRITATVAATAAPAYRLADYLDQHGRRARRAVFPPAGFWAAAARCADPGDLAAVAAAAQSRGLLRDAARLRKRAAACGDGQAAAALIRHLHFQQPADQSPARWAAADVPLDNSSAIADLLAALRDVGAREQAATLAGRIAVHAPLDDPAAVARCLGELRETGAHQQAAALLARDPAGHAALDNPAGIANLLSRLSDLGADEQAAALARRAAAHSPLENPSAVADLLLALRLLRMDEHAVTLARRAAAGAALDDPAAVADLLDAFRVADMDEHATGLLARDPAAHVVLDKGYTVTALLNVLRDMGAEGQVSGLIGRLPAAGLFGLFLHQANHQVLYRFGREPDGTPTPSWGWSDLG
jgi:hypothetical protein